MKTKNHEKLKGKRLDNEQTSRKNISNTGGHDGEKEVLYNKITNRK